MSFYNSMQRVEKKLNKNADLASDLESLLQILNSSPLDIELSDFLIEDLNEFKNQVRLVRDREKNSLAMKKIKDFDQEGNDLISSFKSIVSKNFQSNLSSYYFDKDVLDIIERDQNVVREFGKSSAYIDFFDELVREVRDQDLLDEESLVNIESTYVERRERYLIDAVSEGQVLEGNSDDGLNMEKFYESLKKVLQPENNVHREVCKRNILNQNDFDSMRGLVLEMNRRIGKKGSDSSGMILECIDEFELNENPNNVIEFPDLFYLVSKYDLVSSINQEPIDPEIDDFIRKIDYQNQNKIYNVYVGHSLFRKLEEDLEKGFIRSYGLRKRKRVMSFLNDENLERSIKNCDSGISFDYLPFEIETDELADELSFYREKMDSF